MLITAEAALKFPVTAALKFSSATLTKWSALPPSGEACANSTPVVRHRVAGVAVASPSTVHLMSCAQVFDNPVYGQQQPQQLALVPLSASCLHQRCEHRWVTAGAGISLCTSGANTAGAGASLCTSAANTGGSQLALVPPSESAANKGVSQLALVPPSASEVRTQVSHSWRWCLPLHQRCEHRWVTAGSGDTSVGADVGALLASRHSTGVCETAEFDSCNI